MDLQLSGKVAIVTGASRGIGRAIAEALSAEGMKLALVARTPGLLAEVAVSLTTPSIAHVADLREPAAAAGTVEATLEHFGAIDVLVNCAGAVPRGDFLTLTDAEWEDGFALKFHGAMRLCRAAWPHLRAQRGAIVNIAGIGGRTGSAEFTIGGAVNAAMLNLTKALADRGVTDGVRVNAVNPGTISTHRLEARIRKYAADEGIDVAEAVRRLPRAHHVERFGDPAEIGRAVAFLASPQAGYCQGAVLDVDGGQTRTL